MKLLIVCLGNICRSPMGEGALRARIEQAGLAAGIQVDSAGTGGWHAGEPPDRRAIACAAGHGVDIAGLRARQVQARDFADFDWVLCADADNLAELRRRAPAEYQSRLARWLDWAGIDGPADIPDPYYGQARDFERSWRLVDAAALATLDRLALQEA